MEDSSFLKKFTKKVTIVQIEDKLTASHAMQQRVVNDPDITIMLGSTVTEFTGDDNHVKSAIISNKKTGEKTTLEIDGAFIAIGLTPNTKPFKDQIKCDEWGYIKVNNQVHTSVEGVFAGGDVHDFRYRQAITSAGAGCMAALEVERYLKSISE